MNTQEQNREALIRHIADLDAVIRRRNEQIENQAHNARETQRALEEIARERDEARANAYNWKATAEEWEKSAVRVEPRPLTPDAITDEMVDAAVAGREERGWFTSASPEDNRDEMRAIISDALAARRDEEKRDE